MKNISPLRLFFLGATALVLTFSSCKKDTTNDTTTPVSTTGTLVLHIHTNADTNEVDTYGDTLVMTGGRQIAVTTAQLYVSSVQLVKTDGSVIDAPGVNVFVRQGTEEYTIGDVPAGNYKSVKFKVGLSAATNASTPASTNTILYQPSMWFGSTAQPDGFVFVNLQGSIDTTTAANGSNLFPFSYRIGTNAHLVSITMPDQNFTVTATEISYVHIISDYAKLFTGIQLNVPGNLQVNTDADNNGALATQLATNISDMFHYE